MADEDADWVAGEAGLGAAGAELVRMARRARARPLATLLIPLLAVGYLVYRRAQLEEEFTTRIVLRVTEGDLDPHTAPRPNRKLRAYVEDVALSNENLLQIVKARHLYPDEMSRHELEAVNELRAELEIEVWRNYFVEERERNDPGRSARIAFNYRHGDREESLAVAQDLARTLIAAQQRTRIEDAETALAVAERGLSIARAELIMRKSDLHLRELRYERTRDPMLPFEIAALKRSLLPIEERLKLRQVDFAERQLRVDLEKGQRGIEFAVVDLEPPEERRTKRAWELAIYGLLMFVLLLPLAAMAVGAFDRRVRTVDDLRRLGVQPLGHVARFPGDRRGALESRTARYRVDSAG